MGDRPLNLALLHFLLFSSFSFFAGVHAIYGDYPTANLSTTWTLNSKSATRFSDGSTLSPILLNNRNFLTEFPAMGCGFFANGSQDSFFLTVFAIVTVNGSTFTANSTRKVIWTANRNNPVRNNATLVLTSDGDLVLRNVDGGFVWSTNTSGKSVIGMQITEKGNLMLFDSKRAAVWQSFDHPTDTWLPGQRLVMGQRLTANVSPSNWTPGPYYLSLTKDGLHGFIDSSSPKMYLKLLDTVGGDPISVNYSSYTDNYFQFMKLESDGKLRVYQMVQGIVWMVDNISNASLIDCAHTKVCGRYGVCSNGKCSCPTGTDGQPSFLKQLSSNRTNLGCTDTSLVPCESSQTRRYLVEDKNVSYSDSVAALTNTDVESCKQACLNDCSCKAALFQRRVNAVFGNCSLPSQLNSLGTRRPDTVDLNSSTFVKMENSSHATSPSATPSPSPQAGSETPEPPPPRSRKTIIWGAILGTLFCLILFIGICVVCRKRKNAEEDAMDDDLYGDGEGGLVHASGMPRRFGYEELKTATGDFNKRLGGGGFGSVFEGILDDGTRVAVKRLDQLGQGRKEFLAEVKTIGSIHHVNLVTLLGFCAEKSHKLLVYEYMCNGSLDRWIFHKDEVSDTLDWETRRKVILDIAKGLCYLHEGCRKRIAHLDIKPQNILLDSNFNAKVSDFGLARMIDRDQSQVITTMRGTRGYLAPEWLSNGRITEKVDVYSFGVVLLEVMCGRKNLDYSQQEEIETLVHVVKRMAEEDQLFSLVDKNHDDMQQHKEEAVKMIRIAMCCLQDYSQRPPMSVVLKVLDGAMDMEHMSDCRFLISTPVGEADTSCSSAPSASILSGPR